MLLRCHKICSDSLKILIRSTQTWKETYTQNLTSSQDRPAKLNQVAAEPAVTDTTTGFLSDYRNYVLK